MQKVALVTGGSRGLSAEIVRELARQGYDVFFTYMENKKAAEEVMDEVKSLGRRVFSLSADVRDFRLAQDVVASAVEKLGGVHALVCSAGATHMRPFHEITEEDWDIDVDVCLKGSFNYMRAVAPLFQEQQNGKIVCIGSINAWRGRPGTACYNAAKAGLSGLVKTAAAELGPFNVNVNIVAPGFVETRPPESYAPGRREEILGECAIKRLGKPADIASVVAFLVSDAARHVTGQIIAVDAGQSLSRPLGLKK